MLSCPQICFELYRIACFCEPYHTTRRYRDSGLLFGAARLSHNGRQLHAIRGFSIDCNAQPTNAHVDARARLPPRVDTHVDTCALIPALAIALVSSTALDPIHPRRLARSAWNPPRMNASADIVACVLDPADVSRSKGERRTFLLSLIQLRSIRLYRPSIRRCTECAPRLYQTLTFIRSD